MSMRKNKQKSSDEDNVVQLPHWYEHIVSATNVLIDEYMSAKKHGLSDKERHKRLERANKKLLGKIKTPEPR